MKPRRISILLIALLAISVLLLSGCGSHRVIYDGNGHTGGNVPVDTTGYRTGQTVTVFDNTGVLVKTGHPFLGWNTEPDGSGTTYTVGQTLTMGTSSITLYAKWACRVVYDGNGHTGGSVPEDSAEYLPGQTVTISDNTGVLVKTGHVFSGWNTEPDGSGTTRTAGQTLTIGTSNITLYAKWAYRVAYIYNSSGTDELTAATSFETLLDPIYPTDKIAISGVATTDFTQYAIVIIGRNAFPLTADQANLIKNTNLPVIGISRGGLFYFDQHGLSIGENNASGNSDGALVVNNTLTIWNKPNALGVSNGDTVTIFNAGTPINILYAFYLSSSAIHIARYPLNVGYDTIVIEGNNLFWGYSDDASTFTETGRKLFINAINHMMTN